MRTVERNTTPILKAGTLRVNKLPKCICSYTHGTGRGFTLIEVLIAMSVIAIALLSLLNLHLINVRTVRAAQLNQQAVLLAHEKLNESLIDSKDTPVPASGSVERHATVYQWQRRISGVADQAMLIKGLDELTVDVEYDDRHRRKKISISTWIAQQSPK